MRETVVKKAPLAWWLGGLILGLTQVLAVGLKGPLGVSTQFVVADASALRRAAPEYARAHPLIRQSKYSPWGYEWWLDIGLVAGALAAAVATRRWRLRASTVWWGANARGVAGRLATGFIAGLLILLGARFAQGCTSGQFASGWAQLSLSVLPFTVTLFAGAMVMARVFYPNVPPIEGKD